MGVDADTVAVWLKELDKGLPLEDMLTSEELIQLQNAADGAMWNQEIIQSAFNKCNAPLCNTREISRFILGLCRQCAEIKKWEKFLTDLKTLVGKPHAAADILEIISRHEGDRDFPGVLLRQHTEEIDILKNEIMRLHDAMKAGHVALGGCRYCKKEMIGVEGGTFVCKECDKTNWPDSIPVEIGQVLKESD